MTDEHKVLNGVCKSLDGLRDIMESLPETTPNVTLWRAIGEAETIAEQIVNR